MAGYTSKSLLLQGTDEYVTMGNVLGFERTDAFSVSCWFKTTLAVASYLVAKMGGSTTYRGYAIGTSTGGVLSFILRSDSGTNDAILVTTVNSYNDNAWHHAVFTYDGSSTAAGCKGYIDGSLVSTTTVYDALTATIVSTDAFIFGCRADLASFYTGNLDEVSVYNKELSPTEVTWIYNGKEPRDLYASGAPSNLVAWWRCGDGDVPTALTLLESGPSAVHPTVRDIGGSNYTGTMTNQLSTDIFADNPGGTFAKRCLQFDGVNQYVSMGNVLAFERTSQFSWSFWMKCSAAVGNQFIISKALSGTPEGWSILVTPGGSLTFSLVNVWTTNCLSVTGTATVRDGSWHHVVITYTPTWSGGLLTSVAAGVSMYVDGVALSKSTTYDNLTSTIVSTADLRFGTRQNGFPAECYAGYLDEISAYNKVLSVAEVSWVYNSGVPRDLKQPEAPKMLAAYWRLGENAYPGAMTNMESTDISNSTVYTAASPALEYTWRFKNNIDLNTTGTRIGDFRQLLLAMKNALITAAGWTDSTGTAATLTTPWTVVASSNGTVANTSDNWSAAGNLVWATNPTAHSWIVLRQTGINGLNVEFCIDLNVTTNDHQISLIDSYGVGFNVSSPTVNNRPTATDERIRYSAQAWTGLSGVFSGILNVAVSNGGECTRFFFFTAATCRFLWIYDKPKNPVSGWSNPCVQAPIGNGVEPLYTAVNDTAYMSFRANGLPGFAFMSTEFYVDGCIGQRQILVNDFTLEWPITRIGLTSATSGVTGKIGEMSDMWFGDVTLVNGDTYPAVAPLKQFIQVGDLVLPWDRSTPVTT